MNQKTTKLIRKFHSASNSEATKEGRKFAPTLRQLKSRWSRLSRRKKGTQRRMMTYVAYP